MISATISRETIDNKVAKVPPALGGFDRKDPPKRPTYMGPDVDGPGWLDYFLFLRKGGEAFFNPKDQPAKDSPPAGGYILNPSYHIN